MRRLTVVAENAKYGSLTSQTHSRTVALSAMSRRSIERAGLPRSRRTQQMALSMSACAEASSNPSSRTLANHDSSDFLQVRGRFAANHA